MYVCVYVCMYVCMCVCMYVGMCVCMCVCVLRYCSSLPCSLPIQPPLRCIHLFFPCFISVFLYLSPTLLLSFNHNPPSPAPCLYNPSSGIQTYKHTNIQTFKHLFPLLVSFNHNILCHMPYSILHYCLLISFSSLPSPTHPQGHPWGRGVRATSPGCLPLRRETRRPS
jgi:hypothetical protein